MSGSKNVAEFPDLEAKLQKPTKKSAFEKQRAEAEAKRQREAAETAAVYEDFVKSFDHDDDADDRRNDYGYGGGRSGPGSLPSERGGGIPPPSRRDKPMMGFGGPSAAPSRRHFGLGSASNASTASAPLPKSGPGSLGPAPSSSYGRKRGYDTFQGRGRLGYEEGRDHGDSHSGGSAVARAFHGSDDEDDHGSPAAAAAAAGSGGALSIRPDEPAVARPTLRLAQLPPGTSPAVIRALIPPNLTVEGVKIIPPGGPAGGVVAASERRSAVAIVTLSQETPANEIDAAVSTLQNRYLGYGYYLSLHRHLSSAVSATATTAALPTGWSASAQPFGAKPVAQPGSGPGGARSGLGGANMQTAFHRGFAPPTSYGPPGPALNRSNLMHVPVRPPGDLRTLQLINKVIELVLEHGAEFEALLMTRPEVQREEKWAWIWDARSEGGIWYRWRLWEIITGSSQARNKGKYLPIFEDNHAWKAPDKPLAFEYTTAIDEFVSDSEYNSSDDEDFEEASRENPGAESDITFLNPLEKAKLTHLLARLPTTLSRIRKGDVARITAFALTHASRGADEIVDMIVANVETPYSLTGANPDYRPVGDGNKAESGASSPEPEGKAGGATEAAGAGVDTSAASLVGLYVVSDILSSSSTSGLRHGWRFRQLFEAALKERGTFEHLGAMADRLRWGRLRADKWKRSVGLILNLWEGWCVFPAESQELFVSRFENPPVAKAEGKLAEEGEEATRKGGRWKLVEVSTPSDQIPGTGEAGRGVAAAAAAAAEEEPKGEPMLDEDVMGEPMDEEDVAGEPMDEADVEGEPMEDGDGEDVAGEPMDEDDMDVETLMPPTSGEKSAERSASATEPKPTRRRMRAVDMFADSDGSESE